MIPCCTDRLYFFFPVFTAHDSEDIILHGASDEASGNRAGCGAFRRAQNGSDRTDNRVEIAAVNRFHLFDVQFHCACVHLVTHLCTSFLLSCSDCFQSCLLFIHSNGEGWQPEIIPEMKKARPADAGRGCRLSRGLDDSGTEKETGKVSLHPSIRSGLFRKPFSGSRDCSETALQEPPVSFRGFLMPPVFFVNGVRRHETVLLQRRGRGLVVNHGRCRNNLDVRFLE